MVELNWSVRGNCDKIFYSPGDLVQLNIWIDNNSEYPLRLSNIEIVFDSFRQPIDEGYNISYPQNRRLLNTYYVPLPTSIYGRQPFTIEYNVDYFDFRKWVYLNRYFSSDKKYFINILSRREIGSSRYTVFLSRSLRQEDQYVGDVVAQRIRQWNLGTRTVGIEIEASDTEAANIIRNEIRNSDALVALATPRSYDLMSRTWRTLDWLHDEAGIAFGINKPLMIIKEASVTLGGLPRYLTKFNDCPLIEYRTAQPSILTDCIDYYMPYFREAIKKDRSDKFFHGLAQAGIIVLASIGAVDLLKNAWDGFISNEKVEDNMDQEN